VHRLMARVGILEYPPLPVKGKTAEAPAS
jgi:hypothetical protein